MTILQIELGYTIMMVLWLKYYYNSLIFLSPDRGKSNNITFEFEKASTAND